MPPPRKKKQSTAPTQTFQISGNEKADLLAELGRSPEERPIFSLPSPLLPWGGVLAALLLVFVAPPLIKDGPVGALLIAALTLALLVILLLPRKLLLGQDGLLLVWILGSKFIRFRDIQTIEMSDGAFFHHPGINLIFKDGRAMDFTTSVFKERWAERDVMIRLLRVCTETARSKQKPPVEQSLSRAGKSLDTWVRSLRAMGHGAHFDPRKPAVRLDDLWRIAESPDASLIDRTAAFVALSATNIPENEQRLELALDDTVAPLVRSALRAALDAAGDETKIADLLGRVEKISNL
jgi:hypothetical protein